MKICDKCEEMVNETIEVILQDGYFIVNVCKDCYEGMEL